MAQNDVFRLSVIGVGVTGQELVNVHHYRQITVGGDLEGVPLIDAWFAAAETVFPACFNEGVLWTGFESRNLTQPEFGVDYTLPAAEAGLQTGECLPPSSSAIVSWRSQYIGRRRRGRTYMWPAGESAQNAGQITPTYQGQLTSFGGAILTIGTTVEYEKVIYSPDPPPATTALVTVVSSVVVPIYLGSQRRRRPGVGS